MSTPTQEIKDKLDIVEFIRSYIPISPSGKNFKALCPFHKEKTPSFIISPERQTWHCFGSCGEGGDIFKFLMKYENLEFYEALKILAEKAGVELKKINPMEQRQFEVLYEINEAAKNFFKKNLAAGKEASDYLKERGLKKEIIEEFDLGYALADLDKLTLYLIKSGFNVRDIERAGLNFKTERGGYVDRFRGRIMFPIHNHFGKVIGFTGRILPQFDKGETGKYINSPETSIFNKSKILYGFYKSKNFIREQGAAMLVEGQMDFLMSYSDGVKNVVATSGTALTADHLKTLKRQTGNLIFCFDNDEAGLKAAERSIDLANNFDFEVKLLILKDYKDPAEMAQKKPGLLGESLKEAKLAMEFYFERYLPENAKNLKSGNINELKNKVRIVLEKIKKITSPIERNHWLKELSQKISIKEEALAEEMKQLKSVDRSNSGLVDLKTNQPVNQLTNQSISRRELIAQRLLSLAMAKDDFKNQVRDYFDYLPDDYLAIARILIAENSDGQNFLDERLANVMNLISLRSSFESQFGKEKIIHEYAELIRQLRLEYLKEKKENLMNLIKEAEAKGDEEKASQALREFDSISKMIHN